MAKASKSSKTAEKKAAAAALLEAQTAIKNQLRTAKACCATTAIAPFKHVERKGTPKMTVTVVADAAKGASMLAEASALVERNTLPVALAGAGLNGGISSPESEGAPSLNKKTHQLVMGANDEESQFLLAHSSDAADPAAAVDAENVDPKAGGALLGFVRYRCAHASWFYFFRGCMTACVHKERPLRKSRPQPSFTAAPPSWSRSLPSFPSFPSIHPSPPKTGSSSRNLSL